MAEKIPLSTLKKSILLNNRYRKFIVVVYLSRITDSFLFEEDANIQSMSWYICKLSCEDTFWYNLAVCCLLIELRVF